MEKVIRDGKVAVLYSSKFGSGWTTWNRVHLSIDQTEILLFHPILVEMVENDRGKEITSDFIQETFGIDSHAVWCSCAESLKIEWVPQGSLFYIEEYDGKETVIYKKNDFFIA